MNNRGSAPGAWIGRQLGPWTLIDKLGEGSGSEVYLAGNDADASAAIKLYTRQTSEEERQRFLREAKALARVEHLSVVRVLDAGASELGLWLAMEPMAGPDLGRLLETAGPLPPELAAALAAELARGLGAIHASGLVHRDLKPSNVLLDGEGRPKVGDFSMVRDLETRVALTVSGTILGTPHYMAPEQCDALGADARADVYALGALVYHLVAGRPPFESKDPLEVMIRHVKEIPVPLHVTRPGVPLALSELVERCLAKRPEERPADGAALAAELEATGLPAKAGADWPKRLLHG